MSGVKWPSQPSLFLNPFNMRRGRGEEENPSINKTTAFFLSIFAAFLSHKFLPKDIRGTISLLCVGGGVLYSFCNCSIDKVLDFVGKLFSFESSSTPSRGSSVRRKLDFGQGGERDCIPTPSQPYTTSSSYSYVSPPASSFGRETSYGTPTSYRGAGTSSFSSPSSSRSTGSTSSSTYPSNSGSYPPVPFDHPSQQSRSGDRGVTPSHTVLDSYGVPTAFHFGGKNRGPNHGKKSAGTGDSSGSWW